LQVEENVKNDSKYLNIRVLSSIAYIYLCVYNEQSKIESLAFV